MGWLGRGIELMTNWYLENFIMYRNLNKITKEKCGESDFRRKKASPTGLELLFSFLYIWYYIYIYTVISECASAIKCEFIALRMFVTKCFRNVHFIPQPIQSDLIELRLINLENKNRTSFLFNW